MLNDVLDRAQSLWYILASYRLKHTLAFVIGAAIGWLVLCSIVGAHCSFIAVGFLIAVVPILIATRILMQRADAIKERYDTGKLDAIERKIDHLHAMEDEMELMEKRLTEQVARYEMVFKHVAESIFIINADTCEIVDFNDSAAQALGYTRDEFRNLKLSDIDHVESDEDVRNRCQQIARRRSATFHTTHICKDGTLLHADCNSSVIRSNGDTFLQTICRYGV